MVIAYSCILIAAVMPLFFAGYAKFSSKGFDNANPREFLAKLDGRAKRANNAQLNSFEAFPAFAVSVMVAQLAGVSFSRITILAICFIIFRILYGFCYIFDKPSLRSTVWFGGFLCVVTLFVSAILR